MIFEKINTILTSEELLNKSFRRASRAAKGKNPRTKIALKMAQESMLLTSSNILSDNLSNIVRQFPSFDNIPEFYRELADVLVGVDALKTNIASVQWAGQKIHEIGRMYVAKLRRGGDPVAFRKEAFGRISSIMRDIDKNLRFLNDARNKLRKLPEIGIEPTIVVAGYPNVGKSSFVSLVSSASPRIATYPFTTKGLAVGHFTINGIRHQVVDTPGLLDRPLGERNRIELQAVLALQHLGNVLLFIIDPTGTCGYQPDDQLRLLDEIKQHIDMPVLVAANKSDLLDNNVDIRNNKVYDMTMSTLTGDGVDAIQERLVSMIDYQSSTMT
jgi:nucleolar GTP-binding protein